MKLWLFLSLFWLAGLSAQADEITDLAERARPSVMLLTVKTAWGSKLGSGTGFFVSTTGQIVTNFHVIREGSSLTATLSDGREVKIAGALACDPQKDLAVLKAEGGPYAALPLGDSGQLKPGQEVVVVGNPLGLSSAVTRGIISAIRDHGPLDEERGEEEVQADYWRIQIDAAISPGSSGSPIMDKAGQVIAVAVGMRGDGQAVNFGIPIQALREVLAGIDPSAPLKPLSTAQRATAPGNNQDLLVNLEISAAFFASLGLAYWVRLKVLARARRRGRGRRV